MKKALKIAGALAVVAILVCNLQYALISFDITNSSNKASAAWIDSGSGNRYCGTTGDRTFRTGTWVWVNDDYYAVVEHWYGYDTGYYVFYPNNSGTQCGVEYNPYTPHNNYHDVTNIPPTMVP
ncbi:hypothetical protein SAMN05660909_01437 [Chitinophaga terrae (ex Kim and Jung 2007)]|jgi:hypothetical protein|uniref:Uncharacterized protein n=1 Tax=Chitinophaga terrae (ex Kim and Jung 2007) TaxID=408074 RepID=A0A1H4A3Z0_9BACT|nr:hypothetical protein [Chitinophaga terrae (ex Kim and Jung 2007)]GEP90018.1 hypothetical protein CTE07_16630 [Chitinophaga terrae (ex Kim and Jung 2007)]SEA30262.1 hypothetical protein SAMN05660909_01437 [Chitinophaga terrae (ex Kim and Jung 2007)]